MITPSNFEKLSKEEQNFRWSLFLESDGYKNNLSNSIIEELREKYLVRKEAFIFHNIERI